MITGSLDTLQRTPLPAPLNRIVAEVVQSVERWLHAPLGKQEVDGLTLFCLVSEDLTEPVADRRGEFHEQYLDIQLLLRGEEWIGVGPHAYSRDGADHPHPDLWFVDDEQTSYLALRRLRHLLAGRTASPPLYPDDPRSGQEAGRQGSPVAADRRLSGIRGLESRVIGPTEARCESLIRRARQTNGLSPTI